MKNFPLSLYFLVGLFGVSGLSSAFAAPVPAPKLVAGTRPVVTVAGGEKKRYAISLKQGHFLHVVAQQMGVDLGVRLFAPDGKKLIDGDSPNGQDGPEALSFVAPKAATYVLEIEAFSTAEKAGKGRFQLSVSVKAAATAQDKLRLRAENLIHQASHNLGESTLPLAIQQYQTSLPLWTQLKDDYWKMQVLAVMGKLQLASNRGAAALASFEEALPLQRQLKDRRGEADSLQAMGIIYAEFHQFAPALDCDRQALAIYEELKDADKAQEVKDHIQAAQEMMDVKAKALV